METPVGRAVALIYHPDGSGRVCALSLRNKPDDIGLPGGKIEGDETPEKALIRECREELGIIIAREEYIEAVYEGTDTKRNKKLCRTYLVKKMIGVPEAKERGFKLYWVRPEELLNSKHTLSDYNRRVFEALAAKAA